MTAECRNCRHWSQATPLLNDADEPLPNWGVCQMFGDENRWHDTSDGAPPPAVRAFAEDASTMIYTRDDFSCAAFEQK